MTEKYKKMAYLLSNEETEKLNFIIEKNNYITSKSSVIRFAIDKLYRTVRKNNKE